MRTALAFSNAPSVLCNCLLGLIIPFALPQVLCAEAGDAASAVALVSALNNVRNLAARAEVNPLSAAAAANIAGEESIAVSPSSRAVDSSAAAFILSELLDRECLSACVVRVVCICHHKKLTFVAVPHVVNACFHFVQSLVLDSIFIFSWVGVIAI